MERRTDNYMELVNTVKTKEMAFCLNAVTFHPSVLAEHLSVLMDHFYESYFAGTEERETLAFDIKYFDGKTAEALFTSLCRLAKELEAMLGECQSYYEKHKKKE